MATILEGAKSTNVLDAAKLKCPNCDGVEVMLTGTMADQQTIYATMNKNWGISNGDGTDIQCLVGLCAHCGTEWIPLWYSFDVITFEGGADTTPILTNLDASVASTLIGCVIIPMVGTDIGKYTTITANTLASPTACTVDVALADDTDGICMVTNLIPVGLTAAS